MPNKKDHHITPFPIAWLSVLILFCLYCCNLYSYCRYLNSTKILCYCADILRYHICVLQNIGIVLTSTVTHSHYYILILYTPDIQSCTLEPPLTRWIRAIISLQLSESELESHKYFFCTLMIQKYSWHIPEIRCVYTTLSRQRGVFLSGVIFCRPQPVTHLHPAKPIVM